MNLPFAAPTGLKILSDALIQDSTSFHSLSLLIICIYFIYKNIIYKIYTYCFILSSISFLSFQKHNSAKKETAAIRKFHTNIDI